MVLGILLVVSYHKAAMLTKRQYVEYLIATTGNYTCTNLADHLDGAQAMSHDAISDFLRRGKLTPRRLWETVGKYRDRLFISANQYADIASFVLKRSCRHYTSRRGF